MSDHAGTAMRIEHVALYAADLEKVREFFVTYLGGKPNAGYHNPVTGFRSYFLTFNGGARLEIMQKPGQNAAGPSASIGYAHVAFSLGSVDAVNALTDRLRSDGFRIVSGPRITGDGYYESCIVGVEGNLIELTV